MLGMLSRGIKVLLFVPQVAFGLTLGPIHIEKLFSQADIVAIVQVSEGHLLGEAEKSCGARYKGHVEHLFKGDKEDYIDFGNFQGFEIGGRYLLFLSKQKDGILELYLSMATDSDEKAFVADYRN